MRTQLSGAAFYYISPSGNNLTGDGSSSAPWASIAFAWDWVGKNIDVSRYAVTFYLADGTYAPGVIDGDLLGSRSPVDINIVGNLSSPESVLFTSSQYNAFTVMHGARATLTGFKVVSGGSSPNGGSGVIIDNAFVRLGRIWFGDCSHAQINASGAESTVQFCENPVIVGSSPRHVLAEAGAKIAYNGVYCTTWPSGATYTFSDAFASANEAGAQIDFTGTQFQVIATIIGKKYHAESCAVVKGSFANSPGIPGTSEGTTAYGGQYR